MSHPPPGLGGGVARAGPPPGFGASNHPGGGPAPPGGGAPPNAGPGTPGNGPGSAAAAAAAAAGPGGGGGAAAIVRAQIVFLLTTFTEESFDKAAQEIRSLASTHGPEMYHHYVRRTAVVANNIIQTLIQHSQQYKDDPAAPPPQIPTNGSAALAWRLLATEAVRAARDVSLAPHFTLTILSPSQGTPLPLPSFRLLGLPPPTLFSLCALTLASPHIFPASHPSYDMVIATLHSTFQPAMEVLRSQNVPFWATNIPNQPLEDMSLQEARTLILAIYPRAQPASGGDSTSSRPATPTNPTPPHGSPLDSIHRGYLLASLTAKFASPAIVLQTLSALSPGGPPRSPGSIPLEEILFELGENLTSDEATVEATIARWWGPYLLAEENQAALMDEVVRTIAGLCNGMQEGRGVDVHSVIKGIAAAAPLNYAEVLKRFDMPQSILAHPSSLTILLNLLIVPPQSPVPPIAGIVPASPSEPTWNNLSPLLFILHNLCMVLTPDALPLFAMPNGAAPSELARIVEPIPTTAQASRAIKQQAKDVQAAGMWNTLGLVQVLVAACAMADAEHGGDREERADVGRRASELLERAAHLAPELVLIAFEKLPKPLPPTVNNMHSRLLSHYLTSAPDVATSSQLVFYNMLQANQERLLSLLADFYSEDENNVKRIVEIAMELKILDKLLTAENLHLALDVAALGSTKEILNLEDWLSDCVSIRGPEFLQAMFDFIEHKLHMETEQQSLPNAAQQTSQPATLGTSVYAIFIRVIRNAEDLSQEDISRFKTLRTDVLVLHPRLLNLRPQSKEEQGFAVASFPEAVMKQVDQMYGQMYDMDKDVTLDDVISELKRCQASADAHDQEVFACALHSLFDEYKFVKAYPQRELIMTGVLFGAIIDERLVKDMPAFVATRYVLDSCKVPPTELLFTFGVQALNVLRKSLVDFPGLCRSLLDIPALHELRPALIADVQAALAEREEIALQGGVKLAFSALRLPILIEEGDDEFKEPDPKIRDAIMFIINNIAPDNFEAKSKELVKLFENQYSRWFAHYFIDVRVSLELNRHDTYMSIVKLLDSPVLDRHILWETYRKARDLLNAEATMTAASERQTLKTVATWLGRITLARSLPIRHRELSVKDLLIQAYDNKRLIVAIPFVCNLMATCEQSSVFHLPNPWMSAILGVLVELYHYGDLRLNLKFEIEVCFRALNVQIDTLEPAEVIRNHVGPPEPQAPRPDRLEYEYQRAFAEETQRFEQPVDNEFNRLQAEQAAQAANEQYNRLVDELIRQLPEQLVFNSDFGVIQAPTFKRIVHHSIARAIREIIAPVVERSVTIAGISTRDLVQKDFATEGEVSTMRDAAHYMVETLAGNLALVTCKEPLRTSLIANIRSLVSQNGFSEENVPDAVIAGVVNENIDVACEVVRKAAMEKAVKDIDVNLQPQFNARRALRESRPNQPFWDSAAFNINIPMSALPEPLRLHPNGLSMDQLRVYEDFAEMARPRARLTAANLMPFMTAEPPPIVPPAYRDDLGFSESGMSEIRRGPSPRYPHELVDANEVAQQQQQQPPQQALPPQTALERFHELIAEVEKHLAHAPTTSVQGLPADHEIRTLFRHIITVAHQAVNRESTTLVIAQKVVQLLYKTTSPLGREVYVVLLQQLCSLAPKVDREVKSWLIYAEDHRKFNVPVTVALIRSGFIRVNELDAQIVKLASRSASPAFLDFVAQLIRECSLSDQACVPRNGFAGSVAALLKAQEIGRSTTVVDELLDDLRGGHREEPAAPATTVATTPAPVAETRPQIDSKTEERLAHYFLEWMRVYSSTKSPETAFVPYITYLQKEGILAGEDISSAFYRTAINCAVEFDTSKMMAAGGEDAQVNWYGTDALARLIVLMVKNYGDKSGPTNVQRSIYYFNKIITIISYALVQRHLELADEFEQRPWARFFTSLLSELRKIEPAMGETYLGCIQSLANVLGIIQPTYAPRFAFGWLSIVSHRYFMPKLLQGQRDTCWDDFHRCLMWLLRFLSPFLKSEDELSSSSRSLFRATLRMLLVVMHDFPEFLVEYYHTLSTAIPTRCFQLRNIILAAFPQSQGPLPDCYLPLEQLVDEMQEIPVVRSHFVQILTSTNVKTMIEQYVANHFAPEAQNIVTELKNRIAVKSVVPAQEGGTRITYNHTLLHATVFYLGTTAIEKKYMHAGVARFEENAAETQLLANLLFALDAEGQYYLLSVVADQLRYPSAHTLYFVYFILYAFYTGVHQSTPSAPNSIAERVTRVLLERVLTNRPHPWGVVVAFVELLENPNYDFWIQPFVRAEQDIFALLVTARDRFAAHRPNVNVNVYQQ